MFIIIEESDEVSFNHVHAYSEKKKMRRDGNKCEVEG